MVKVNVERPIWSWISEGAVITIVAPDGRRVVLQGDDAARFLRQSERTHAEYTDSDLCAEYAEVLDDAESDTASAAEFADFNLGTGRFSEGDASGAD